MTLPPFSDFLASINADKLEFDLSLFTSPSMKELYNPFPQEQYDLMVRTDIALIKTFLFQYHQWLSDVLSERESE